MERYLQLLAEIYNALLQISTKGDDTILMGQCLQAYKSTVEGLAADLQKQAQEKVEEENEQA